MIKPAMLKSGVNQVIVSHPEQAPLKYKTPDEVHQAFKAKECQPLSGLVISFNSTDILKLTRGFSQRHFGWQALH